MKTAVASLAFFLALFLSIAFLGASAICLSYWGYWAAPPRIDSRVTNAKKIVGCGGFNQGRQYRHAHVVWCEMREVTSGPQHAIPTGYPIQYDINQLKKAGISLSKSGKPPVTPSQIERMPLDNRIRVRSEPGCNTHERFRGLWMELEGQDNQRYLFVMADGGQVSNDHYPHYRLLYSLEPNGKLTLVSNQLFYFDIAGMEGMEWDGIFELFTIAAVFLAIISTGIYVWVKYSKQQAS